ncbi:hypothetical protein BsWGS_03098 [Bradybaena similaris]
MPQAVISYKLLGYFLLSQPVAVDYPTQVFRLYENIPYLLKTAIMSGNLEVGPGMDFLEDNICSDEQQDESGVTEDAAVWCDKCGIHNIGGCFIHGGSMTVAPDNVLSTRACMSLPKILTLKRVRGSEPCSIEAKKGVFSKKFIKLRTLFGPMEAKRTQTKPKLQTGMMEYQLQSGDQGCEYLDITDENSCNWMMFVRPANVFSQQNMAAFQDNGNIYFVTCKNIPKGTELRVWYAAAYAKAIGKRILPPGPTDKKYAMSTVKKGKTSLQDKINDNSFEFECASGYPEPAKSSTEKCNVENTAVELKVKAEPACEKSVAPVPFVLKKSTRSVRATKDNSPSFSCNTCSTAFSTLSRLDSHVCKELGEGEDDISGHGTRRRKGKPRKLLDNEEGSPKEKSAKVDLLKQEACSQINNVNIPHEDIICSLNGDGSSTESAKLFDNIQESVTLLPLTALIPTTTELSGDDGENRPSQVKRGSGRPKNSKNKNQVSSFLKSQVKDTPQVKRYTCQFCEKSFTSQEQHLVHESTHTNTLPYTCAYSDCGKSFNSKFKYQRHLAVHMKPNNFKCKFCPSTFNRVDHLKNHLLVHDGNRGEFTCSICGKSYLYKTSLTFHMARHEAEEGDSLRCLVCNTKCESKEDLRLHVNTHNRYKKEVERQRKHSCGLCQKLFTTAKDIRRHMVTHSKERHFLCEHCPQTFVRKDHLRRHYTSNHKEEFYESQLKGSPFGCSACLLVFKKKEFLDYHMKSVHPGGIAEARNPKDKPRKPDDHPAPAGEIADVDIPDNAGTVVVTKSSPNQLVRLLQNQSVPKENAQPHSVNLISKAQHSVLVSKQQSEPYPWKMVKNEQNVTSPYTVIYPATLQSTASQTMLYESEERPQLSYTELMKTASLKFHNQLPGQTTSDLHQLPIDVQQQGPQQQIQHDQQTLLNQIQIQQQQTQAQQQQFQRQQQEQLQTRALTPVVHGMSVDVINSLTGLAQPQDVASYPNTSYVNIITLGGHNFILGSGQVLDLNKSVQVTVIKDPQLDNKLTTQQQTQPDLQHLGIKSEANNLLHSGNHVFHASVSKPDHCYATASVNNSTLSRLLNSQTKAQLPLQDKSSVLTGPSVKDGGKRFMAQIKNTDSGLSVGLVPSLPENPQGQNGLLTTQQLQQVHHAHFQQQENHQPELLAQQPLQNLSSFTLAWPDNLPDYGSIPVTELPVTGDVTSLNQVDGLSAVVPGPMLSSWILQLPASMSDQQ